MTGEELGKVERTEGETLEEVERTGGEKLEEVERTGGWNSYLLFLYLPFSYLLIFQIFLDTIPVWCHGMCPSEFLT